MPPAKPALSRRILRWSLEALALLGLILLLRAWHAPHLASETLPRLAGLTLEGQPVDSAGLAGQAFIVHVWASWCPICRLELKGMAGLAQEVPVISMAWQSGDDEAVRAYLAQQGVSLAVLNDPQGRLAAALGVVGVPLHLVVDGAGRIRFIETGYTTPLGLRLRLWWAETFS